MTDSHIYKPFDQELQTLASSVGAMGDFAGAQFADSIQALLRGDLTLAQRVIDQDRQLDALRRDLSSAAASVIARRQPMAIDLNEVLADFRISDQLERIGDLAKNIAKRATAIARGSIPSDIAEMLERLSTLAADMLKRALDAISAGDAEKALLARQLDEEIDQLHTEIFRELVSRMSADQTDVINFVHLLFCAKNIERIGDHATNIAEAAYFKVTGQRPPLERRRLDESSLMRSGDILVKTKLT